MYVVVPVTSPMPWSMLMLAALVTDQFSVDDSSCVITVGSAVKVSIAGRLCTITVKLAVLDPKVLVAVSVYTVVTSGETSAELFSPTLSTP